ncbi:unnamed protein product [Zymoseptoria tritici ST99CH_1A5]|uniref:Sterol 3-beta-glucosyltransferase n=1 Tax=Zymoseptoria tritici ST99CH_1A5 TaxID=1276529 RepID=A0A1Y6LP56_ZYMTR|nr:unnamed protein product [Zymoseptoria tritici ST99CH_1A5]
MANKTDKQAASQASALATSSSTSALAPIESSTASRTHAPRIPSPETQRLSLDLPERFRFDSAEEEDVDDGTGVNEDDQRIGKGLFPQHSIYGLLAATQPSLGPQATSPSKRGSSSIKSRVGRTGLGAGFGIDRESDSESGSDAGNEAEDEDTRNVAAGTASRAAKPKNGHRKRLSENKLVRKVLRPVRERADSQDLMTQSQFLPPRKEMAEDREKQRISPSRTKSSSATDLKREAAKPSSPITIKQSRERSESPEAPMVHEEIDDEPKSLSTVLAQMFQFEQEEEVIAEYPCWYTVNVLLQGKLYITGKHVCFYAFLPKRHNKIIKTGHIGKVGKHSYRYLRYWFLLKGETFSYFKDSHDPYFPLGVVDLRNGISADITTKAGEDTTEFTLTTQTRVYKYKADTPGSAMEWVKQLRKVMFRCHNDGNAVKISLPLENIVDIERTGVVKAAETIKLRVVDNEETFAVDEYFFTLLQSGDEAWNVLKDLTDGNNAKQMGSDAALQDAHPFGKTKSQKSEKSASLDKDRYLVAEPVRTTLSRPNIRAPSSPRRSIEQQRSSTEASRRHSGETSRASVRRGRRSVSATSRTSLDARRVSRSPLSPVNQESESEGLTMSSEHTTGDEIDASMSASQMLSNDGVFRGPTLRPSHSRKTVSGATVEKLPKESEDLSSSRESSQERLPVRPSTKPRTEQALPVLHRSESSGSIKTLTANDKPARPTQGLMIRGISTPLQHAMNVAGMVRTTSKRMSSYLSSSPKDYLGKFSGALAGGKIQYDEVEGLTPDDSVRDTDRDASGLTAEDRFQRHFGLALTEKLTCAFYCCLIKTVPVYGKIYMGSRHFCFRSLFYGTKTKIVIPYRDIINVQKQRGFRWGHPGMCLIIRGYEELFFDFSNKGLRDDCAIRSLRILDAMRNSAEDPALLTDDELQDAAEAAAENNTLQTAKKQNLNTNELQMAVDATNDDPDAPPILFDDDLSSSMLDFKPKEPMNITCLTIGSRGDVQPYIALCKGFIAEGHRASIATHAEFGDWVKSHGIEFKEVAGDPAELMRICVDNGMFTPAFFMEANSKFRSWLDGLLITSYEACKGSDLLIESPSAMGGIHIAEALQIPYFRAFTMPWTRTRAYPHAFAVPGRKLGGVYNSATYTIFDGVFWQAMSGQINRWRRHTLDLPPTSLSRLQQDKVPFLYNFSPSVVAPPLDFADWVKVTGYWFLDEGTNYSPPPELADFISRTRAEGRKLVYIGFGSVTVADSRQLMQQVMEAVRKADVNCILSKGWSDRFSKASSTPDAPLPDYIHQIRSAPHDWLFTQVDAVVHHGGAGTTGASLRAGKPTIIKPFFGDQWFFANRVEDLGVGSHLKKVSANQLGKALWVATHDARMMEKAKVLGEKIRSEDGVGEAIKAVYRDMEYAKSLVTVKKQGVKKGGKGWWAGGVWGADGDEVEGEEGGDGGEEDEMWELVDDEKDSEAEE